MKYGKSDSRSFQVPGAICETLGYGRLASHLPLQASEPAHGARPLLRQKKKKTEVVCCVLFAKPGNHSEKRQAAWQGGHKAGGGALWTAEDWGRPRPLRGCFKLRRSAPIAALSTEPRLAAGLSLIHI